MKKLFIIMTALMPVIAVANKSNAQTTVNLSLLSNSDSALEKLKATDGKSNGSNTANINEKAVKNFSKTFKGIRNETWDVIIDGFAAEFVENGVRHIVYYNKKGLWQGNMIRYTEDQLPATLQNLVEDVYPGYKINGAVQVETRDSNGIPTFLVHVENKKSFKTLRIYEGEIEEYKVFPKN